MLARVLFLILAIATLGDAQEKGTKPALAKPEIRTASPDFEQDPLSLGEPLSYWIASIRARDKETDLAFDAIMSLGARGGPAIPELARIVAEPFVPVRVGIDNQEAVLEKLLELNTRVNAINALAVIGDQAVSSAQVLIRWALSPRVVVEKIETDADYELFVEMITIDVLERMRVASVVNSFGVKAAPAIQSLLTIGDSEGRKFAVAILNDAALPIIDRLLKSKNCGDRSLGVEMLLHMWPVVAKGHLSELKKNNQCR
jgi:hypothetical protein